MLLQDCSGYVCSAQRSPAHESTSATVLMKNDETTGGGVVVVVVEDDDNNKREGFRPRLHLLARKTQNSRSVCLRLVLPSPDAFFRIPNSLYSILANSKYLFVACASQPAYLDCFMPDVPLLPTAEDMVGYSYH